MIVLMCSCLRAHVRVRRARACGARTRVVGEERRIYECMRVRIVFAWRVRVRWAWPLRRPLHPWLHCLSSGQYLFIEG